MKLLAAFFRIILSPRNARGSEDFHARLIRDWIGNPSCRHVHPQCTWTLAEGHPQSGTYVGVDFYDWYIRQRAITYQEWDQVVTQVIGSQIGAIVVGPTNLNVTKATVEVASRSLSSTGFVRGRSLASGTLSARSASVPAGHDP